MNFQQKQRTQQEVSSDSIARLDELKGGMQFKVSSFDILTMGVGKYLLNKTLDFYHAKYEPAPTSDLAIISS